MRRSLGLPAALVGIAATWALTFPFTKIAVLAGYRTYGITFLSSSLSIVLLAALLSLRRKGLPLHFAALWRYAFSAVFGTVIYAATAYKAAEHLPSGVLTVCVSTLPFVSLLMSMAVRLDRATPVRIAGLGFGLVGVLLIALPDTSLPEPGTAIFIPVAILSVVSFAIEGIMLGKLGRAGLDPIQLLPGSSVAAVLISGPVAFATGTLQLPRAGLGIGEWAIIGSATANTAACAGYFWMVGRAGPVFAAQTSYLVTGFGVVWSMLLLSEVYSSWVWAGIAVILAGMALVQPRPRLAANLAAVPD